MRIHLVALIDDNSIFFLVHGRQPSLLGGSTVNFFTPA